MIDPTLIERLNKIANPQKGLDAVTSPSDRDTIREAIAALSPNPADYDCCDEHEADYDCCDEHETVYPIGGDCPQCVLPDEVAEVLDWLRFEDRHKAADLIERLWGENERLKGFERVGLMSGQNIGLRLMDAEARIDELERENERLDLENGELGGSRDGLLLENKKLQARIDQLTQKIEWHDKNAAAWKADAEAAQARIGELERDRATMAKTISALEQKIKLQLAYINEIRSK